jgi:hypothetical protein
MSWAGVYVPFHPGRRRPLIGRGRSIHAFLVQEPAATSRGGAGAGGASVAVPPPPPAHHARRRDTSRRARTRP